MSRRMQAVALGCVTVLWVLASPFITVVSLTAVMLSDAGVNDAVMAMIYIAWGWPPILLMAVVLIWVGFFKRRLRLAWIAAAAPLFWMGVIVAAYMALSPWFPSAGR